MLLRLCAVSLLLLRRPSCDCRLGGAAAATAAALARCSIRFCLRLALMLAERGRCLRTLLLLCLCLSMRSLLLLLRLLLLLLLLLLLRLLLLLLLLRELDELSDDGIARARVLTWARSWITITRWASPIV